MRQIKCENCSSTSFVKVGNYLVCSYCKTVYFTDDDDFPEDTDQIVNGDPKKSIASDPDDFVIQNNVLEQYIGKAPIVPIPPRVTKIGPEAFANTDVAYVGFPAKLTSIGKGAFRGCKSLTSVEFHKGLEELGDEAFMESGIRSVLFPEDFFMDLDVFGERVFQNCQNLQSVEFPEDVYEIPAGAFRDCHNLKEVVWPKDLTDIGDNAFQNTGITSLILPDTVSNIGEYAFAHTDLSESELPPDLFDLGEGAFSDCKGLKFEVFNLSKEITWLNDKIFENSEVGTVKLPSTMEGIDAGAFHNARIGALYLPKSVEFEEPLDPCFIQHLYLEDLYFEGESDWARWKDDHSEEEEEDWVDPDWYDEEHEKDYDLIPGKDLHDRPIVYWYLTRYALRDVKDLRSIHFPEDTDVQTLLRLLFPKKGLWTDRLNDLLIYVGEDNLADLVEPVLQVNRYSASSSQKASQEVALKTNDTSRCRFVCEGRVMYRGRQVVTFSRSVLGLNSEDTMKQLLAQFPVFLRSKVSEEMRKVMVESNFTAFDRSFRRK